MVGDLRAVGSRGVGGLPLAEEMTIPYAVSTDRARKNSVGIDSNTPRSSYGDFQVCMPMPQTFKVPFARIAPTTSSTSSTSQAYPEKVLNNETKTG
jgi:hypothetical protein